MQRVDLMAQLMRHPQATYLLRVRGESMIEAGIFDNDVVMVDRAITPRSGQVVVAVVDGDFVCKTLYQRGGRIKLKAANPTFADITPKDGQTLERAQFSVGGNKPTHDLGYWIGFLGQVRR